MFKNKNKNNILLYFLLIYITKKLKIKYQNIFLQKKQTYNHYIYYER